MIDDSEDEGEKKEVADEDSEGDAEASKEQDYSKKRRTRTKEDIEREALLMEDLYAALGLEDQTFEASEAAISKAYKKAALKHHPDKLGDKYTENDKKIWLQVQKAYETLTDPAKRKKYDSSLPFDEKIPSKDDITEENFYEKL